MIAATAVLVVGLLVPVFDDYVAPNCAPAATAEQRLRERYGEELVSSAVTSDGKHIIERWESMETGSWTLLVRTMGGLLCMMSNGAGWHEIPIHLRGRRS